jgi:antitoxin (DNA-binding transcriptional repressor) of toxin-antitoxin stability system
MAVIHISETDAARDFASLMAHVRAGEEVVIESDARAVAVVRPAVEGPGRLLSESIALAEARGSKATVDEDFARDVEKAINSHREPLDPPSWD